MSWNSTAACTPYKKLSTLWVEAGNSVTYRSAASIYDTAKLFEDKSTA